MIYTVLLQTNLPYVQRQGYLVLGNSCSRTKKLYFGALLPLVCQFYKFKKNAVFVLL